MHVDTVTQHRPSAHDFWTRWLAEREYFRRMCVRWLRGDRQEVEEVLSRGALRALEFLRQNPGGVEKFRPWALRILHNLCLDTLKFAGRDIIVDPESEDDESSAVFSRDALPDREVFCGELRTALTEALAELPPRLWSAFCLRFVDDLAYDEICSQLGITPENARKRIQQARAHLREQLAAVA